MLVADEMQRLSDEWPGLPAEDDLPIVMPPLVGHVRRVRGTSLQIVYMTSSAGLHFIWLQRQTPAS
jgi:hypothetical protein